MKPEDLAAIQRRQRLAEAMLQRSQRDEPTNQTAGGYVVPYSPVQGIAKIANQLAGTWIGNKAGEDYNKALSEINLDDPNAYQNLMSMGMPKEAMALKMLQSRQTRPNYFQPTNQVVQDEKTKRFVLKRYGSDPNQPPIVDDATIPHNLRWIDKGGEFVPVPTKGTLDGQPPVRQESANTFVDISPDASPEDRDMLERIARDQNVQPAYTGQRGTGLKKSLTPDQALANDPQHQAELTRQKEAAKQESQTAAMESRVPIKQQEEEAKSLGKSAAKFKEVLPERLNALEQTKTILESALEALAPQYNEQGEPIGFGIETGGSMPDVQKWYYQNITNDPARRALDMASSIKQLNDAITYLKGQGQVTEGERAIVKEMSGIDPYKLESKTNYKYITNALKLIDKQAKSLNDRAGGNFDRPKGKSQLNLGPNNGMIIDPAQAGSLPIDELIKGLKSNGN